VRRLEALTKFIWIIQTGKNKGRIKNVREPNASIAKQLGNKRKKVDLNTDDYFDQLNNSVDIMHSAMKKNEAVMRKLDLN
jgi:hypothetical protein